jgi:hypothetical protein
MLNAKKKRAEKRARAAEDRKEKWCSAPGREYGVHGSYVGRHCPKCMADREKKQ